MQPQSVRSCALHYGFCTSDADRTEFRAPTNTMQKALMSLRNTSMLLFWACLFDEMNMNIFSLMENGCEIDGAEISSKFPIRTPLACSHISSIDGSNKTPSGFLELTSQTNTSQTCYRQRSHRSALFLLSTLGFSCHGGFGQVFYHPQGYTRTVSRAGNGKETS